MITYLLSVLLVGWQGIARDSVLAEGVRLAGMQPAAALLRFEAVLARDSLDAEANWRAAIALNDLAEPLESTNRDTLLARAQGYARRAVRIGPENARALFSLGLILGNQALSRGLKERVRSAVEIRELALRALTADSLLDGAHHLLGRWNYEVMRLSGFERFVARKLLGGGTLGRASWAEAQRELERAVALDPTRIYHRLDLARVYLARRDRDGASAQLDALARLPDRVAADSSYRRQARELLSALR